jgi:hypothetical protein
MDIPLPWMFIIVLAIILIGLYLVRLKPKTKSQGGSVVDANGVKLKDTPEGKLGASIMNGICPDCGSKEGFYRGPKAAHRLTFSVPIPNAGVVSTLLICLMRATHSGSAKDLINYMMT